MLSSFLVSISIQTNLIMLNNSEYNQTIIDNDRDLSIKVSGSWTIDHIFISSDNWSDTSLPWIQVRSGTVEDPHLIENVTLDAGGVGNAIFISGCSDYFIINNCTIRNSQLGYSGIRLGTVENAKIQNNHLYDNFNAIRVDGLSSNNTITNNNISNGNTMGIYIDNSDHNSILNNTINGSSSHGIYILNGAEFNELSYNTIKNNHDYGIIMQDSCHNNTIFRNTIDNNGNFVSGIYLFAGCTYNNISNNIVTNSGKYGIQIEDVCNNLTINENIIIQIVIYIY